jgi:hypothetical protein
MFNMHNERFATTQVVRTYDLCCCTIKIENKSKMSKVTYNYSLGKIMMKIDLRTCNQKERPVPVSPNLTQTSRRFVKFELLFTEQMCDNDTNHKTYKRHKFEVKEPKKFRATSFIHVISKQRNEFIWIK